jgi:hypothetical protein
LPCAVDQRTMNCHVFDKAESRRMPPLSVCPLTRDMTFWKGTKDVGDAKNGWRRTKWALVKRVYGQRSEPTPQLCKTN